MFINSSSNDDSDNFDEVWKEEEEVRVGLVVSKNDVCPHEQESSGECCLNFVRLEASYLRFTY